MDEVGTTRTTGFVWVRRFFIFLKRRMTLLKSQSWRMTTMQVLLMGDEARSVSSEKKPPLTPPTHF
jgi:hypothetical protein